MMVEQIVKYIILGTILLVVFNYLGRLFTAFKDFLREKMDEQKYKNYAKEYLKQQKELQKGSTPTRFYGLFEFRLENCDNELDLKKDFCATIKEKMSSKYKNSGLQIAATDKIFFNCTNFSKIDSLIDDFIILYNFFVDINKKRSLKTDLKFSIWTKAENASSQRAYKILSELNNLDYTNQVIANEEIYKQYKKYGLKMFDFHPRGAVKLIENDEEIELYRLLKTSVS